MRTTVNPQEKVLVEADDFTPPAPNGPPPAPRAVAFTKSLNANIDRLKLDIVTIAPLHGFVVPVAELKKLAGVSAGSSFPSVRRAGGLCRRLSLERDIVATAFCRGRVSLRRKGDNRMKSRATWIIGAALAALYVLLSSAQTGGAPKHKPLMMTRLYTGPDGQTHFEETEAKFSAGGNNEVFKLMSITGAELHRAAPGTVIDWHTAPRRQYVITLSGQGEIEVAGGKKFTVGPGHIDLVEDTTGKGHITRVTGNEDRVTLQLPLSDQARH